MKLKYSTATWQRIIILSIILGEIIIPCLCAVSWHIWEWPEFPKHRKLEEKKYIERLNYLKYIISLGFTILGATWYLVNNQRDNYNLPKRFYRLLSWSWSFFCIAILNAIMQVYLTYEDFFYWPLILNDGGYEHKMQPLIHFAYTRLLHITYNLVDYSFFAGAILLVMALTEVLNITNQKKKPKSNDENKS